MKTNNYATQTQENFKIRFVFRFFKNGIRSFLHPFRLKKSDLEKCECAPCKNRYELLGSTVPVKQETGKPVHQTGKVAVL